MRSRGGDRHDGRERFGVAPFLNHSEYLCSLLDDERLHGIARALCGDDYQYWNSDGKYYVGDTRWHSDGSLSNPVGFVKLALYLDPVDADSGALRVIPGSHRTGEPYAEMIDEQIRGERFWGGLPGDRIPAVALTSRPGDLVLFNQALKHGAWGGGNRRRMFTINYTRAITPAVLERYRDVVSSHGYTKADVFGDPPGPLLRGAPRPPAGPPESAAGAHPGRRLTDRQEDRTWPTGQPFGEVAGKVAVVTGAARGLGQGTAETLAAHGVHVVAADILPAVHETMDGIRAAHPGNRGYAQETDVSDEGAVRDLVEGTVKELGRLDIMVNNAGMHLSEGPVADMDVDVIDRIFAVNFKGIFFGCKHAARQMREQKGGTIVNLGSYGGKLGFPEYAAYCSSKGAVHTLTISLAREMAPYRVTVNALCPGLAATEMHWSFMRPRPPAAA